MYIGFETTVTIAARKRLPDVKELNERVGFYWYIMYVIIYNITRIYDDRIICV